jgi:hypothetical protein
MIWGVIFLRQKCQISSNIPDEIQVSLVKSTRSYGCVIQSPIWNESSEIKKELPTSTLASWFMAPKNADLCPISGKERRLHAGGWIYRRGGDIKPAISGVWTQRWVQSSSGFSHGQNTFYSTGAIFPSLVGGFKHLDDFPFHIWIYGMSSFPLTNSIIFQDGYCTINPSWLPPFNPP